MAQAKLSERERVSVLMMRGWGDRVRYYNQVRLLLNRTFRNGEGLSLVSKSTIERTVRRFMNLGSIKDLQRTGRPKSAGSEEMQMDIAQALVENPHLSLRRASDEGDVAPETVRNILKSINLQAPRNVRSKGTHANQAPRNMRGKGTQREPKGNRIYYIHVVVPG